MRDRNILISGASKGLGAVAAVAFSQQGARVALLARSSEKLEEVRLQCQNPQQHIVLPTDILKIEEIHFSVTKCLAHMGHIDVVLHAAGGGMGFKGELLSHDEFQQLFMLNLGAAAEINRLVVPEMKKRGYGRLVHVGSIASSEGVGSVGYNTVKAGLAAYVRTLGRELARHQIVATGISPGGFIAPGNAMDRLKTSNPEAYGEFIKTRLPRNKMGEAQELLPLLLLLCSEGASMMAGCMVPVDAGEGRAYNHL